MDSSDFINISDVVPDVITEIRYYSTYNFIGDRIDGYEEPIALMTKEATKAFQADHGLAQDGIAGPKTIEKAKVYKKTDPDPPTAPTTPPAPAP